MKTLLGIIFGVLLVFSISIVIWSWAHNHTSVDLEKLESEVKRADFPFGFTVYKARYEPVLTADNIVRYGTIYEEVKHWTIFDSIYAARTAIIDENRDFYYWQYKSSPLSVEKQKVMIDKALKRFKPIIEREIRK